MKDEDRGQSSCELIGRAVVFAFLLLFLGACEDQVLLALKDDVYAHAPFISVFFLFGITGQFMGSKVFTRERAYASYDAKWKCLLMYWGRETLALHPISLGFLLGMIWRDPEGAGWGRFLSAWYFASAGGASLFLWVIMRGMAKAKGVHLTLPGDTDPPPSGDV